MPTIGPLAQVNTQIQGLVTLEVGRLLNWGPNIILELIVVDTTQGSGWRTLRAFSKGFNRIVHSEETNRDGSEVIFRIADLVGDLGDILRQKELHVRVDGQIYRVANVPPLASNEAQVYTLTCKIRTMRPTGGFDNAR